MSGSLVTAFRDFQRVLVICPCCGEIHRLSELKLAYRGRPERTWLDELRDEESRLARADERFQEQKGKIREKAQERGRKQLPRLLRKCVPTLCARGYYPQDVKALFDPVDFVVFDGLNRKDKVSRVVLFDGPAESRRREKVQASLRRVIKAGNYSWRTVKIGEDGRMEIET